MSSKIAITGSTGLIGETLVEHFKKNNHQLTRVVRKSTEERPEERTVEWDIDSEAIDEDALDGHDIVIHLAGANIAGQKWTPEYKRLLYSSRVDSTRLLCDTLAQLEHKPEVLLCASAIGYYGPHPASETVDERTPLGKDYLAQICQHWEAAAQSAKDAGIRVVHMRFGVVLSAKGGALAKMLPPFKWGLGGKVGSGEQVMSWIVLEEIPLVVEHLCKNEKLIGAVNIVSPNPVFNKTFTESLGKVLHRPTMLPLPAFAVKLLFGEMGETLLLNGANVIPKRLQESGYQFKYTDITAALESILGNGNDR